MYWKIIEPLHSCSWTRHTQQGSPHVFEWWKSTRVWNISVSDNSKCKAMIRQSGTFHAAIEN